MKENRLSEEGRSPEMIGETGVGEELSGLLQGLARRVKGITGAIVVDSNGLDIASVVPGQVDPNVLGAVSTLMAQSAGDAFGNLGSEGPEAVLLEGRQVNIVIVPLGGGEGSLLALLDKSANLGLVKIEMRKVALRASALLGAQLAGPTAVRELFVIYRSGVLIRHYSDTLRTDLDRDILSSMLTAVQQFVKETLASKVGDLEQLKYGNYTIHFLRGKYVVVAAVVDGPNFEALQYPIYDALEDFEEKYAKVLEDWNGSMQVFPGIDECFLRVLKG